MSASGQLSFSSMCVKLVIPFGSLKRDFSLLTRLLLVIDVKNSQAFEALIYVTCIQLA